MPKKPDDMMRGFIQALNGEEGNLVGELRELLTGDPKELQRKHKNKEYEKYLAKFESTIHLWRLDDKEWVNNRKSVWERILNREIMEDTDFVKSYWDEAGRFFLKASPRVNDKQIYLFRRMAYTPFSSVDEIRDLYLNEHVSLRRGLHEQLLKYACGTYRAVPEEFYRVRLIADALYCKEYVAKKEPMGHDHKNNFVVYYPRDFIISYTGEAIRYLKRSNLENLKRLREVHNQQWTGRERSYSEVTIEYFIDVLEYAVSNETDEYGGVINDLGINGVNEMCSLIESYNPDIPDKNRDQFVSNAYERIINNNTVKKVREM